MDGVWKGVVFTYEMQHFTRQSDKTGSKREAFGHVHRRLHTAGSDDWGAASLGFHERRQGRLTPVFKEIEFIFLATAIFDFGKVRTASTANVDGANSDTL